MRSVLSIVALLAIAFNVSAQDWVKAEGISTQMSVTSIQENDGKLVAFGQKQWRENMNFFSEPCAYSSTDNGATWTLMDVIYNGNSTANTLLFTDGRIITSGRDGDVQLDWVGAVKYSDDNGYTWIQVTTIFIRNQGRMCLKIMELHGHHLLQSLRRYLHLIPC